MISLGCASITIEEVVCSATISAYPSGSPQIRPVTCSLIVTSWIAGQVRIARHWREAGLRTYSSPLTYPIPTEGNLAHDLTRTVEQASESILFSRSSDSGEWYDVSAADFLSQVNAVAKGLIASGVQPGNRIAIYSRTRYEWTLFDYAIWSAGGVSVPLYETSSSEQIQEILDDSGAMAIIAEGSTQLARLAEVRSALPMLIHVWSIEDNAVDILGSVGADVDDEDLADRRNTAQSHDVATIIYTSGTTGKPKGCLLTHANFMFELGVAVEALPELFADEDSATLLFLPLAHIFARVIQVGCVRNRVRLGHCANIKDLAEDLQSFRPSFVLAVPRVFEKLFNAASQRAVAHGKGRLFERATETAVTYSRALDQGRVPHRIRIPHALFSRLVYGKVQAALGGRCAYVLSGGAPLGERLGHYFRGIGITVLEGYGLTETTGAVTVNTVPALKIGTVGRPLPGTSVKVSGEGELQFRGGQVFDGYWTQGAEDSPGPSDPFDDGWFSTGDLGEIDDEGFVRITGRKKEMIVTAGGKNVSPAVLEDRVRLHPLVSQCLVIGDGQPFIGALITVDPDAIEAWLQSQGRPLRPLIDLIQDSELRREIAAAVADANRSVSQAESIRKFEILAVDWTEEGGHLTPSLKLKRALVMREFKSEIAQLYAR
jgi:long-chain acyl-CoA synthetase